MSSKKKQKKLTKLKKRQIRVGVWPHLPTSEFLSDFWILFNLTKTLSKRLSLLF